MAAKGKDMVALRDVDNCRSFFEFLKNIASLSRRFSRSTISDVKACISSFTIIFSQCKNQEQLKTVISRSCNVITKIYSKLSVYFHQCDRHYVQDLYCHWKEILDCIEPSSRANCCLRNIFLIKISIGHLRVAANRLEQISILSVVFRYMEDVSVADLLTEQNENDEIVFEIAKFAKKRLPKSQHVLIDYINMEGDNIFTVKPTKITAVDFNLNNIKQKQSVWLDFNVKSNSVTFVVLSQTGDQLICLGIVSSPQIRHYVLQGEYQLVFTGQWILISGSDVSVPRKSSTIMFTCHVADKFRVDSLKNLFNIAEYTNFGIPARLGNRNYLESVITADTETIFFQNNDTSDDDEDEAQNTPLVNRDYPFNDDAGKDSDYDFRRMHSSDTQDMLGSSQSKLSDLGIETFNMDQSTSDRRIMVDSPGRRQHPYRIRTRRTTFTVMKKKICNNKRRTTQKVLMAIDRIMEPENIEMEGENTDGDSSSGAFH